MNQIIKERLRIENAIKTNDFYKLFSPYDKDIIAEIEIADSNSIELAFNNAVESYKNEMMIMPSYIKVEILNKVADLLSTKIEEFSYTISLEGGKPLKDAIIETNRAINSIKMCATELQNLEGTQIKMDKAKGSENYTSYTFYEPLGVVLAISAFNHPLNLICHQVATAFAAGNSIIVKPASQTPLSCLRLVDLFYLAGCPRKAINVLTISGERASKIVSDSRLSFVSFIGSAKVGWDISKNVHNGVKVALEHGGIATAVVEKTCNFDETISSLIKGSYYHSGQVCISTQIIYVQEEISNIFLSEFISKAKELKCANPLLIDTDMGPIVNKIELNRILDLVNDATNKGAKIELGGKVFNEVFFEPTVITCINEKMRISNEEAFGPIVCICAYNNINDVIETTNSKDFAFQVSIFSNNIKSIFEFSRKIVSKTVIVNEATTFRVDWMPFGGFKNSGFGVGGIKHSITDMSNEKLIILKH
ncbi:MAG: aldehyde dehydrogenase family protein [Candidatus Kapabacteria bacterium]|nr:aldehyde dehydrogenase family protein [Candidatus Kapabacteria bacterium]